MNFEVLRLDDQHVLDTNSRKNFKHISILLSMFLYGYVQSYSTINVDWKFTFYICRKCLFKT